MADRLDIDPRIAAQKMFCLRIVSFAQYLFDENLPSAGGGDDPKQHAQRRA